MAEDSVVVACPNCAFRWSFPNLRRARVALDDYESKTGHAVDWEIRRVADGVERASADAGICGRPDYTNSETPLLDWMDSED